MPYPQGYRLIPSLCSNAFLILSKWAALAEGTDCFLLFHVPVDYGMFTWQVKESWSLGFPKESNPGPLPGECLSHSDLYIKMQNNEAFGKKASVMADFCVEVDLANVLQDLRGLGVRGARQSDEAWDAFGQIQLLGNLSIKPVVSMEVSHPQGQL